MRNISEKIVTPETTLLNEDIALRVAYVGKEFRDTAAMHRAKAASLGGWAVIRWAGQQWYDTLARDQDRYADGIEKAAVSAIENLRLARWYAPSKSIYNRAIRNARAMAAANDTRALARELEDDFARTPVEAFDHIEKNQKRSPFAEIIERCSMVLSSDAESPKATYTLGVG